MTITLYQMHVLGIRFSWLIENKSKKSLEHITHQTSRLNMYDYKIKGKLSKLILKWAKIENYGGEILFTLYWFVEVNLVLLG